jgi:NAD(P)-dependent dehydrogenase (short-subunit alcohol dehydrogenase family)
MRLADKIAIITGAASGIGRASARRFAKEGAKVVIADINEAGGKACAALIKEAGGQATFVHTDVSVEADLQAMIDSTIDSYGRLDILYNNAYWTDAKTVLETTVENWQHTLDVTLRPVFLASKMAVPHMRAAGGGVIINTGSVQSVVGVPGYFAYQAAKGAVMSLTRALAVELVPDIRVVAVLPGAIDTPAVHISDDPNFVEDVLAKTVPMKRLGTPDEVANVALFLASDEASYITGTGVLVDGGFTVP